MTKKLPALRTALATFAILASVCLPAAAVAGDDAVEGVTASPAGQQPKAILPFISVETSADLQFNLSTAGRNRRQALFTRIEPEITVNLTDDIRLFSHLVYEPVRDPTDGETSIFRDQGLYSEELYAAFKRDRVEFKLGKIDPLFGLASDAAPGIYGGDLASRYDMMGALGVAARITLSSEDRDDDDDENEDSGSIEQTLDIAAFTSDTTVLSRSLIVDRGIYSWSDSKVANTGFPSSFAIAYDYATLDEDDEIVGPSSRLAIRRLASRSDRDEWDMLAAGKTAIAIGDNRTLKPMAEIAYFINEGGLNHDAVAGTAGLELDQDAWSVSFAAAIYENFAPGQPRDYLLSTDVGRAFDTPETGKFRVDLGYRFGREEGEPASMIGLRLLKDVFWSR
jgi:hypothetical protein